MKLFASTYALILLLATEAQSTSPARVFYFFLNNLFLTIDITRALLFMGILVMGITRKNMKGFPKELIALKEQNTALIWNSAMVRIIKDIYCFLWQDNSAVLGMTTAYTLDQKVYRERKRPAVTSTNAYIVRPVFGDAVKKWLYIPRAINDYNYYINSVDRFNQLRKGMTIYRPFKRRIWRP